MENLGKQFWDEMKIKNPNAVDVFLKWIDEYKTKILWNDRFGEKVKFHDLPYEMQMGIMNRFFIETYAGEAEYISNCQSRYQEQTRLSLEQLNSRLNPKFGNN